jgi:cell division protein FtsB
MRNVMAAITDLNAAVAALQAEQAAVSTAVTDLVAEVAALKAAGVTTAAIEAAVTSIKGVTANLTTDAAADPGAQA